MIPQIRTVTQTRTAIRTQIVCRELDAVNRMTVNAEVVTRMIDDCVPSSELGRIFIRARRGDEVHACMIFEVDYLEHKRRLTLDGFGTPLGEGGADTRLWTEDDGHFSTAWDERAPGQGCPVWRRAIEWFCEMARSRNPVLDWAVSFRDHADELARKYGLIPDCAVDRTVGADEDEVPHSSLAELRAWVKFSLSEWPKER